MLGFYKIRLVQDGPYVPAVIYQHCPAVPCNFDLCPDEWFMPLERSRPPRALINGRAGSVEKVLAYGKGITRQEYELMLETADWAREYAPDDPLAKPYKKVNNTIIPELF